MNLAQHINWAKTTLMTDGHNSYVTPPANHDILHIRVEGFGHDTKLFNTVNSAHSYLKKFMKQFNGVATKYLDNYLAWFQWRKQDYVLPITTYRGYIEGHILRKRKMTLT